MIPADDQYDRRAIAIVGMASRFAQAPDLHAFWSMCRDGIDGFSTIPADLWPAELFYSDDPRAADMSHAPKGGFLDDICSFPALALSIPPRRAEVMDPQQRLALEMSLEAIADAGLRTAHLPRRTGVYIGATANEYRTLVTSRLVSRMMASGLLGAGASLEELSDAVGRVATPRPYSAPGMLVNMIAATVAQELRIHGPAFVVDAACASSLVAVDSAVTALRAGQIELAVAGGVYLCVTPENHIAFSRLGAISPTGRCLPFDARADGFVQGDGCGIVVLKRLQDARRDNDRVYAVLRGSALNNDGGGAGPMAPIRSGQVEVIREAWKDAGLPLSDAGYLEAHGTGTEVGDANEVEALAEVFADPKGPIALGSAKANVGHTMAAAGVAGLIRAALALYHGCLPPIANYEVPKEELARHSQFKPLVQRRPWDDERRLAGVSSFGFGGTNAHVVLTAEAQPQSAEAAPQLVLLSSHDEQSLRKLAARTAAVIDEDRTISPAGAARAWAARPVQPARLGIVAASREELIRQLRGFAQGDMRDGAQFAVAPAVEPRIGFLFPGQGAQRLGMLRDLQGRFPAIAGFLKEADALLATTLGRPLTHFLYPERRSQPVSPEEAAAELTRTQNCQPALVAAGLALSRLLREAGVEPAAVCGHSTGEFAAAAVAGVVGADDCLRWTARRGQRMAELPGDHGAMLAIMEDAPAVRELLVEGAAIANINHPRQTVVSGRTDAVAEVGRRASQTGIRAVQLHVSHGFHSPVFERLQLDDLLSGIVFHPPEILLASGTLGTGCQSAEDARRAFRMHATAPVQFTAALHALAKSGVDIFLQVAAGGPLVSFVRETLGSGATALSLASSSDEDEGRSLLGTFARLFVRGVNVRPEPLISTAPVASIPPAVLPRERYWCVAAPVAGAQIRSSAPPPIQDEVVMRETRHETVEPAPYGSAPCANAPSAEHIGACVLDAAAAASSWPRELLREEMRLVEDLGFDSMMVTDMIVELESSIPAVRQIQEADLINMSTLSELTKAIVSAVTSGGDDTTADTEKAGSQAHKTIEVLSLKRHPFLSDHCINGRHVLPMAFVADWLATAAGCRTPFEIDELCVLQPVIVDDETPTEFSFQEGAGELRIGVDRHIAYRGACRKLAEPPPQPTPLKGGVEPATPVSEFYRKGTFHGPRLQAISSIDAIGDDFIRGRVRTSRPTDWLPHTDRESWTIDPLALDGAMQLGAYAAWTRYGRQGTPLRIEKLVQTAPFPQDEELIAEVRFQPGEQDRFEASLTLRDESGRLILHVHRVVAKLTLTSANGAKQGTPPTSSIAAWPEVQSIRRRRDMLAGAGYRDPYFDVHQSIPTDTTVVAARTLINFSTYNYLGLMGDPRVQQAARQAIDQYGTSCSASRVAAGERPLHRQLEQRIADSLGVDDALAFPSGHSTNVAAIGHLFSEKDLILHDELIHDSCLQGIRLSGAARRSFQHDDPDDLRRQLQHLRPRYRRTLILIEGVYSMDGDIPDVPAYVEAKRRFDCLLMVDEAHSFGTIGGSGLGVRDHFSLAAHDIDIWMGTLSKSLASMGGYIAGGADLIDYLRYTTPGFLFSNGLAPPLAGAANEALRLMRLEPWRAARLQQNARLLHRALKERGLDLGCSRGAAPVVPVIIGDSMQALAVSERLLAAGIHAKPIIYPAVAEDASRLRLFVSALHNESDLALAAERIADFVTSLSSDMLPIRRQGADVAV